MKLLLILIFNGNLFAPVVPKRFDGFWSARYEVVVRIVSIFGIGIIIFKMNIGNPTFYGHRPKLNLGNMRAKNHKSSAKIGRLSFQCFLHAVGFFGFLN